MKYRAKKEDKTCMHAHALCCMHKERNCNSFAYLMLCDIFQFSDIFVHLIFLLGCSVSSHVQRQFDSNICATLREDRELQLCSLDNRIIRPWGKFRNESKSNLNPLIGCLFGEMEHKHYTWCVSIINGPKVFWPCCTTENITNVSHI